MKNDDKIKVLLAKVEEQKAGLGVKPRGNWLTNGVFKFRDHTNTSLNINVVADTGRLVEAVSFLLEKQSHEAQALAFLGLPAQPMMWDGYPVDDWKADLKKRVEMLAWEDRKAKLEDTKKKLKALVSEETRTEMELADIEKLLN